MHDRSWSAAEKKLACQLFEKAFEDELAETLATFKSKAQEASLPEDMWAVRDFLSDRQRDIDSKYDYRYSQLIFVFGRLLRERRIRHEQLAGLDDDKRAMIERTAGL
jgi:hypothetical protein